MHKDCHNHDGFLNCSVGLGSYSEGELWIEASEGCLQGVSEVKYKSNGEALMGVKVNIYHRPTMFHPKQWHQTCQWKGQRWVLTAYVSRGLEEFSEMELRQLRKLGFKEEQPTRLRMTRKRPPTTTRQTRDATEDENMEGATEEDHEHRPPHPRREQAGQAQQLTGECWWATVKEHQWPEHEASFWSDHRAAVEVDVELPAGKKKLQYAARDFENYFAHQLKRRAVEVSERRLTPKELQAFQQPHSPS
ncbi:unnamed protein product [Symbiodinium microadriaticum]|nr:unnamed protein product [Symbiodinium microadriaticum]